MRLFKCLNCHSNSIDEIIYKNKIAYKCYACGKISKQAYTIDSRLKLALNSDDIPQHFLAALVVRNRDKVLLLNRRGYPYGWSLVMGHVHNGETSKQAAERELVEETGCRPNKIRPLFSFTIDNDCDAGITRHKIYVFGTTVHRNSLFAINGEAYEFVWTKLEKEQLKNFRPMSGKAEAILDRLIK